MTDPVRRCPDHGYTDGTCPVCGATGETVLSADRRTRLSKFLSGALRHFPDDVGLSLDDRGWVAWADLVTVATDRYPWADEAAVAGVVATDPKGRFERDSEERRSSGNRPEAGDSDADTDRVRAAYGHSVAVDLEPTDAPVPDELYHGTTPDNVDAIRSEGLKPMSRQQVHLSASVEDAHAVGRRHAADPVVFEVDAAALLGEYRITKRGNETYTVDRVPPSYLTIIED
ncbi:RNA 2'-phosphotransferase [Haloplanus aerogenes]|uniref:Probable RNA 2'-phosphotransferase n=1 Tax=Haloplanus aerogenes TaxID=660522 RepID=A0A3M0DXM1_9EURY|nr:RNA 2'-phosphotransferase [Haloplanus aerogenes]AZH25798.1 RNA 2'-phosphotransferase [Haloplanus aerogenes]RMB25537.1 putative RNA 2'-phosphotransferase [Haloplanus aerogenes]